MSKFNLHPLSLLPVLYHLLPFMNDRCINRLAQCSSDCLESIHLIKRRELYYLISEGNKLVGEPIPTRDIDQVESVSDSESIRISTIIDRREQELSCILPSYVKDFLQICGDLDCRSRWDDYYLHPTNMMLPFEDWDFVSNSPLRIPSRKWINQHFEKWQREKLLVIGYLKTMRACLLVETVTGVLYCFRFNKFTKLLNFTNWYKSFPKIGTSLCNRIEKYKNEQISIHEDFNDPIFYRRIAFGKYRYLTLEMKKDPRIINSIMESGYIESSLPFEYRDNPDFMLEYIRRNIAAFLLCSNRLKFDPYFVEKAFEIDFSMYFISDSRNWNNSMHITYGIAEKAIDSFLEKYVTGKVYVQTNKLNRKEDESPPPPINGNSVIANREAALVRLKENGLYLTYCTEELTSNREIVLTAVQNNGMALSFAAPKFREDVEIVRIALSNNPYSIRLISESFLDDNEEIILDFIAKNLSNHLLAYLIPAKYTANFDLMRKAIILNPSNYSVTFPPCITSSLTREEILKLRHDKDLLIPYIWNYPENASKLMRSLSIECIDKDVVIAVLYSPTPGSDFSYIQRGCGQYFILKAKLKRREISDVQKRLVTNLLFNTLNISTMNSNIPQLIKFHTNKQHH